MEIHCKNEKIKTCKEAMRRKKTYKQHKQRKENKKRKERDGRILEILEIAKYPKKEERMPYNIKSSSSLREGKALMRTETNNLSLNMTE
jgi:hypothetical protein